MAEEDQGFEVVDKRNRDAEAQETHVEPSSAGQSEAAEEPAPGAEPQPDDDAGAEPEGQGLTTDVTDVIAYVLNILSASAWQWMGVMMNPATGKVETDLKQARLAIDTFEAVAEKLAPHVGESANREIKSNLSDMRLNFVERSSRGSEGSS